MKLANSRPEVDEIEISVFSKGYGESILVHVGLDHWIVVDCLRTDHGSPAVLEYLREIGVNPATAVRSVLLTHWHDDHVDGAADLVVECRNATVGISSVLQRDEFLVFLRNQEFENQEPFGSGLDEFNAVLTIAYERDCYKFCSSERMIDASYSIPKFTFEALSPSDLDIKAMLTSLASFVKVTDSAHRFPAPARNQGSVASVLSVSGELILLGADLEVSSSGRGWQAVVEKAWRNRGKAGFFKIPHHGSRNGHYSPVWTEILMRDVHAVLTPWNRGQKLPSQSDVERINQLTRHGHCASTIRPAKTVRRSRIVEKTLRDSLIIIEPHTAAVGHVRLRKMPNMEWKVEYGGDSLPLSNLKV